MQKKLEREKQKYCTSETVLPVKIKQYFFIIIVKLVEMKADVQYHDNKIVNNVG